MKSIILLVLLPFTLFAQQKNPVATVCDMLIRNGKIIDGSGNSWYYGDIAVKDGKIVAAGTSGGDFALARYGANGTFGLPGNGNKVSTDFGATDEQNVINYAPGIYLVTVIDEKQRRTIMLNKEY